MSAICAICGLTVTPENAISCDTCKEWIHGLGCSGLSESEFIHLQAFERNICYHCVECKEYIRHLFNVKPIKCDLKKGGAKSVPNKVPDQVKQVKRSSVKNTVVVATDVNDCLNESMVVKIDGNCADSSNDDRKVFIDVEEAKSFPATNNDESNKKVRRSSDVIDSLEENLISNSYMHRRTESSDKQYYLQTRSLVHRHPNSSNTPPISPRSPMTPNSDQGYMSSACESPLITAKWFLYNQPSVTDPIFPNRSSDFTDAAVSVQSSESTSEVIAIPADEKPKTIDALSTKAPVGQSSLEYNMQHKYRGVGIIFNHKTFKTGLPERLGTEKDVNGLKYMYSVLQLEVRCYDNLSLDKIFEVLREVSEEDHIDRDCLMVSVLTHGFQSKFLWSYDNPYSVDTLWSLFTGDKCLTLAGKPKIFFIQACRGEQLDGGIHLISRNTQTDSSFEESYMIPRMADFFTVQSTAEGYYSWRNPDTGTWFIQSLVQVFLEDHDKSDLATMMTRVSYKVAVDCESYHETNPAFNRQKQVPSTTSTLIRKVFFPPKE